MLYSRLPDHLRHIHSRGPKWIGATGNTQHAKGKHSQTTNHANSHVPMGPNGSNTDCNERSPHRHATVRSRLKIRHFNTPMSKPKIRYFNTPMSKPKIRYFNTPMSKPKIRYFNTPTSKPKIRY